MCVRSVVTSLGNTAKCDTTGLPPKPMSFIYVNIHLLDFSSNSLQLMDFYRAYRGLRGSPFFWRKCSTLGYLFYAILNAENITQEPFAGKKVFLIPGVFQTIFSNVPSPAITGAILTVFTSNLLHVHLLTCLLLNKTNIYIKTCLKCVPQNRFWKLPESSNRTWRLRELALRSPLLFASDSLEKKEEIWLSHMTKAPTPKEKSKKHRDNIQKRHQKTSITQQWRTDLGR